MYKTEHKFPLAEIDNVQFRLSCGIGMILSIHTAMEEGSFDAAEYGDAIFGASDYLRGLNDELRGCIDALLKERGDEREAHTDCSQASRASVT